MCLSYKKALFRFIFVTSVLASGFAFEHETLDSDGLESNAETNVPKGRPTAWHKNVTIPAPRITQQEQRGIGLINLCIEAQPNGLALLKDSITGERVAAIFAYDAFWLIPLIKLENFIHNFNDGTERKELNETHLIRYGNQFDCSKYWPEFPKLPKFAISFYGLNQSDKFFQNVFVFKDDNLFRYKINYLNVAQNQINVTLLRKHKTTHWAYLRSGLNDLTSMFTLLGSRTLFTIRDSSISIQDLFRLEIHAYVLNDLNLDNPVHHDVSQFEAETIKSSNRYFYQLNPINKDHLLFRSKTNELCLRERCIEIRNLASCKIINPFLKSFAYFIWQETDFTIRLILVGLSSIMVINFTLAISFIFNQIRRISDLT